jgi:hypothetical protein
VRRGQGVVWGQDCGVLLQALATTPSWLLMLTRLRQSPCTVGELVEAVGMEQQSAVSHQLRLLRALRLGTGTRMGRSISTACTTTTLPSCLTKPSSASSTCVLAYATHPRPLPDRPGGARHPLALSA